MFLGLMLWNPLLSFMFADYATPPLVGLLYTPFLLSNYALSSTLLSVFCYELFCVNC
jgi:hypothetical protein